MSASINANIEPLATSTPFLLAPPYPGLMSLTTTLTGSLLVNSLAISVDFVVWRINNYDNLIGLHFLIFKRLKSIPD
jgi:hypothetical protein